MSMNVLFRIQNKAYIKSFSYSFSRSTTLTQTLDFMQSSISAYINHSTPNKAIYLLRHRRLLSVKAYSKKKTKEQQIIKKINKYRI